MKYPAPTTLVLSLLALPLASCNASSSPASAASESTANDAGASSFSIAERGSYKEPWTLTFVPGTQVLVITERGGTMKGLDTSNDRAIFFEGVPTVDYGGQGGLGDVAFLPGEAAPTLTPRTIYLSWAEAGDGDTRGAVVGKGRMVCEDHQTCRIDGLEEIWRQTPKVTGRGHYSHKLAFSPDGKYLFVSSGDRQKMDPAQDVSNNLGSVVRLNLDGTPAPGNPFVDQGGTSREIWSYGHRNVLGLAFDSAGKLWDLEHGPKGGDELNLVKPGQNYGWPVVSDGQHYNGNAIPPHSSRPDLAAPAISWNPVIAPGDFIIYSGAMFAAWQGNAIIGGMKPNVLVRVALDGDTAREVARYPMEHRIRDLVQATDGSIWVLEDGKEAGAGRLLRLSAR